MHGSDKKCVKNLVGNPEGTHHLGYVSFEKRVILKWMINTWGLRMLICLKRRRKRISDVLVS
jgi:hypothetical protein